jgi:predicted Zn-dependent protease
MHKSCHVLQSIEARMVESGTLLQSNPDSETFPGEYKVVIDDGIIIQFILDRPSGVKVGKRPD